ncbi:HAMP domain-containing protein [Asticcacaulis sp. 201]|uniref:HAMP domain-containing protein n=1 Tax=Asticcacaulis sp. 201 TaxID=3028787 RepID=UPI002916AC83|nr:HAMP domain-containing protein [Asticcacaulis sp. 201]MDV6332740.1 HAMP domain-containing protein [Asticcacaulis sp. 201]
MTIKAKILSLVVAFTLLAGGITLLGLKTMSDYDRIIADYNRTASNSFRGERLNRYLTRVALEFRGIYMSKSEDEARQAADRVDVAANQLASFMTDWRKTLKPGEIPEFDSVQSKAMKLVNGGHKVANVTRTQGLKAADAFGNTAGHVTFREKMQAEIDGMVERLAIEQTRSHLAVDHFKQTRQYQFLLIAGSGILMMLAGSLWIAIGAIAGPLTRVRQSMIRISEGAYDTPIPQGNDSEIGEVWRALSILRGRAVDAERLAQEKLKAEQSLRELVLD